MFQERVLFVLSTKKRNILVCLLLVVLAAVGGVLATDYFDDRIRSLPIGNETKEVPHITALCYHEVTPARPKDIFNVPPDQFRSHIRQFREQGCNFIDLQDIEEYVKHNKPLPEKPVLIAFDDGYKDNYTYAFPILKEEHAKASFFIVSHSIGTDNRMTVSDLKEMVAAGYKIGSHTVNHEPLTSMSDKQLDYEFKTSRDELQKLLGTKIYCIAYPCGYANDEVMKEAKKYYDFAFIASIDPNHPQTLFNINRYGVFKWNTRVASIFRQSAFK